MASSPVRVATAAYPPRLCAPARRAVRPVRRSSSLGAAGGARPPGAARRAPWPGAPPSSPSRSSPARWTPAGTFAFAAGWSPAPASRKAAGLAAAASSVCAELSLGFAVHRHSRRVHPAAEGDLVGIDDLVQFGSAGHDDRKAARAPGLHDRRGTRVGDDHGGAADLGLQFQVTEVRDRFGQDGRRRRAVLDERPHLARAAVAQPAVDPVNQPGEGVVIGPDRDEQQRQAPVRPARLIADRESRCQSSGPTTAAPG